MNDWNAGVSPAGPPAFRLIAALWFGGGACLLLLAAPAAFSASPNATAAANVVGAMLTRWHYIALGAPLILLALEYRSPRHRVVTILFLAIVFASGQAIVDTRIRSIRTSSLVPISSLLRTDPVRRRFGALHGVSSLLLLAEVIAAAAVVAARDDG